MAREIKTEILINASPEKVWSVFNDFNKYPNWNPFVKSIRGEVIVGKKIKVVLPSFTFKPTILVYTKKQELRWIGRFLFKGLIDGEHSFVLIDNGNGTTTFKQCENFKGILVWMFGNETMEKTKRGFESMNADLKKRVEEL